MSNAEVLETGYMQPIAPEMKMAFIGLMREYLGTILNQDFIFPHIDKAIHERDELVNRSANEYIKDRMSQAMDQGFLKKLDDYVSNAGLKNEQRLKAMEDTVADLRRNGMPDFYIQQIHNLDRTVQVAKEDFTKGINRINYLVDTKFVENVTPDEIKALYTESKLGLKHIGDKFNISAPVASRMVNGTSSDTLRQHQLKVFLKETISKNAERGNNAAV